MCGLCGAFGVATHWSDGLAGPGGLAGRRHRTRVANAVLRLYGLAWHDWANRYTLRSQTGKVAMVDHMGALWPAAERLCGRPCDPLDPRVLEAVEARAGPPPAGPPPG